MKQVAVVGNQEFVLGFQLAGVEKAFPLPKDTAENTLKELMTHEDIGLIIIEEKSLDSLSEEMREIVSDSIEPVFLTITEKDENEEMRRLIKKSIGVDLWDK